MSTDHKTIKLQLKSEANRKWYYKNIFLKTTSLFTAFVSAWTILDAFDINFTKLIEQYLPGSSLLVVVFAALVCVYIARRICRKALLSYSHLRVETERSGCSVEIRMADSYLTNAFDNYPNSSMIIGINKAFWFQEAEPGSLVADMWKRLEEKGISKEEVQVQIDAALAALWAGDDQEEANRKAQYIDQNRPKVFVKCKEKRQHPQPCLNQCPYSASKTCADEDGMECRDNYQVGTVIGVDLRWTEPEKYPLQKLWSLLPGAWKSQMKRIGFHISVATNKLFRIKPPAGARPAAKPLGFFVYIKKNRYKVQPSHAVVKKLYFIANSEVVQGCNMDEPMKVTFDRSTSVVENFSKIWEYFEANEEKTPLPPNHILYQPLLIPLIGAGVANEGYSDLEIFSKIVDLYYEHLRKSIRNGRHPAIPNLIINIQSKTAIELSSSADENSRKIDLKTAFDYLRYRNKVNPVVNQTEQ